MKSGKCYIVNPVKCCLSLVIALFFASYGIYYVRNALWVESAFFLCMAGLFSTLVYQNASLLVISKAGICLRFLFISRIQLSWEEIQEVGVIGDRLFNQGKKKHVGTKYIYFSKEKLTEAERFELGLKWPPRHIAYLSYSEGRMYWAEFYWRKPISRYNVGDLCL